MSSSCRTAARRRSIAAGSVSGPCRKRQLRPSHLQPRIAGELQEGVVREDDRVVVLPRIGDDHRHPGRPHGRGERVAPVRFRPQIVQHVARGGPARLHPASAPHAATCGGGSLAPTSRKSQARSSPPVGISHGRTGFQRAVRLLQAAKPVMPSFLAAFPAASLEPGSTPYSDHTLRPRKARDDVPVPQAPRDAEPRRGPAGPPEPAPDRRDATSSTATR